MKEIWKRAKRQKKKTMDEMETRERMEKEDEMETRERMEKEDGDAMENKEAKAWNFEMQRRNLR